MKCLRWIARLGLCSALFGSASTALAEDMKIGPFEVSSFTPPKNYTGPTFVLNHDYPKTLPPPPAHPPWSKVSGDKELTADNALAYVEAIKDYIAPSMRKMILDYPKWDPAKEGWYSMPWLSDAQEPIHGAMTGSTFPPSMFPLSNLKKEMTTQVVTLYDPMGAYMLGQIWGEDAKKPDLSGTRAQYPEGAITIKAAFTTALKDDWSPMEGATTWTLTARPPDVNPLKDKEKKPGKNFDVAFFQFDIIIKDSKAAPDSQWVFSTLVYDKRVKGDAWDRMIPLGAMWGNDPTINSADDPNAILKQSVTNPMAPVYAIETLGYGGRLSGPNDGAVAQDVLVDGKSAPRVAASSCMSCHSVAEWPMKSFLMPMASTEGTADPYLGRALPISMDLVNGGGPPYLYKPGSMTFNSWFQSRPGSAPKDAGRTSLDYHMNLTWKALPLWMKYGQIVQPGALAAAPAAGAPRPPGFGLMLADPAQTSINGLAPKH
jgi:hypothetical protein